MKCISCGAGLDGCVLGSLVKCDFCGTSNAFIPKVTYQNSDSAATLGDSDQKVFHGILNDIDTGEYEDARAALEDLIEKNPSSWQIHTNLAICKFALGTDDFAHLPEVIKHLRKAMTFSSDQDETSAYIRSIAFNVAQVSNLKNRYGQSLFNCIVALEKTKELVPDFPDRDKLIDEFVAKNQESLTRDLTTLLKREKKNFDPPRTLSETLIRLTMLSPGASKEATALALIAGERKNPATLNISNSAWEQFSSTYFEIFSTKKIPTLDFPLFSEPRISY